MHFVVIGGGPTGVEFSGELSDFIIRDVRQRYSHVKNYIRVTLIEVPIDQYIPCYTKPGKLHFEAKSHLVLLNFIPQLQFTLFDNH